MDIQTSYMIKKNWILRSDPNYQPQDTLFDINSGRLLLLSKGLFSLLKLFYLNCISPLTLSKELNDRGIHIDINKILNLENELGESIFTSIIDLECLENRNKRWEILMTYNSSKKDFLAPVSNSPIDIEMHFTHKCNLKCQHCFQESSPTSDKLEKVLVPNDWIDILEKLESSSVNRVIISGGEPLFYQNFSTLSECIFDLNMSYYILSNGTLITKSLAESLSKPNITINVSLDGRTKEIHEILRGNHSYDRTITGIQNLASCGAKVIVSSVIHKQNRKDIENFISYLIDFGVKEATFGFIEPLGRASLNKQLLLSQTEEIEELYIFSELKEKYQSLIKISFPALPLVIEDHSKITDIVYCAAGTRRLAIAANGDAYPCIMAFGKEEFVLGNLLRDNLNDIWKNRKLDTFRGELKLQMINVCNSCKMSVHCSYKNCRLKYYSKEYGLLGKPKNCLKDKMDCIDILDKQNQVINLKEILNRL